MNSLIIFLILIKQFVLKYEDENEEEYSCHSYIDDGIDNSNDDKTTLYSIEEKIIYNFLIIEVFHYKT